MNPPILERDPSDPRRKTLNPGLKFLLELGPGLVFFFTTIRGAWLAEKFPILNHLGEPILIATAFFMVATALSLSVSWILTRSWPIMPLVSAIVVFVFGALALWLQDKTFAFMKPTIINTLFGATLLGGLVFRRSLLGYVFDSAFSLDAEGWRKLTFRWGVFFLFLAVVNEVVWRNFSEETWLYFKVWGTIPITLVFTLSQMPLILRHSLDDKTGEKAGKQ
ncbi:septation protein A [Mesorhizobium sp. PAMC28654]|uniref:septation protein A n=1 Tax=Mesorhizobium sp. PAMC28654 TaxID=2880934 RepID=UPI001D0BC112|nr:septation protein A [Mesorhizobium sp. PAMC28654]UDL87526.1 septation protein A [Mesorhizobium sp. PAMC28654]